MTRGPIVATVFGAVAVGCIVPSFDGMKSDANGTEPAKGGSSSGTTTAAPAPGAGASTSSSSSSGSSGSSGGVPDAGNDASPPKQFWCPASSGKHCTVGSQVCCLDIMTNTASCVTTCYTPPVACSDSADCEAGQSCCLAPEPNPFPPSTVATCKKTCASDERVSCDPNRSPTTCLGGKTCAGTSANYTDVRFCK